MLHIHNSLTRRKAPFQPIEPGKVRMYVCGMTVYDYCHLGHARVLVVFDVIYRWLMRSGYEVTYVRNITDIDDKILARAVESDEPFTALTERFIGAMHEDAAALGVLPPNDEPRATAHLDEIIAMIERLIENGHAYVAANGDVYYAVASFPGYGRLSGKDPRDLRAGARVDVEDAKQDPLDFALWKAAKPGEPAWAAPWGAGRPGWHIECSAMSTCRLGNHFDIHGGGADLQFPHHENEIAQSEGATGEPFVNVWIHNGFVRINDEKMSKSLGNFFTVREILARYQAEEIRYFILTSHYRSPLNYDDSQLDGARAALTRLYTALRGLPAVEEPDGEPIWEPAEEAAGAVAGDAVAGGTVDGMHRVPAGAAEGAPRWATAAAPGSEQARARFAAAMNDDFNTPEALAVLFDLAREINRVRDADPRAAAALAAELRQLAAVLGLLEQDAEAYLRGDSTEGPGDAEIEALIAARAEARWARDFAEADRIRDQLQAAGIQLEDGAGGTSWRRI